MKFKIVENALTLLGRRPVKQLPAGQPDPAQPEAPESAELPKIRVAPKVPADWIIPALPGETEFDDFHAKAVAEIPSRTHNAEEVPELTFVYAVSILDDAQTRISDALSKLQGKIDEYRTGLGKAKENLTDTITSAKNKLFADAKPELETLRVAKTAKAKEITVLRRLKTELPKQIEDAEFTNTGDPRIRVGYITKAMKDRMHAITGLITVVIGGIDLVLASQIFIGAADENTGWMVGAAYALLLGYFMHQSAFYGRQVEAHEEAEEAFKYHLVANPDEKRTVRELSQIVLKRARSNHNWLLATGVCMAAIRLLVAAVTGKWAGSITALSITFVAFALALAGAKILKKYMAAYGDQHQLIGDQKRRLANIDAEIEAAEAKQILEPRGLVETKASYDRTVREALAKAQKHDERGWSLVGNGNFILTSENEFTQTAQNRFVQTCMSVLELVVVEGTDPNVDEDDLLTHFEARRAFHPLAEELRTGITFDPLPTTTATADALVEELDKTTPLNEPAKVETPKPAEPRRPIKLHLRRRK